MQEIAKLIGRQQSSKWPKVFTKVGSSLQSVPNKPSSWCFEEGGETVQPIWTVYLIEIVTFTAGEKREKRKTVRGAWKRWLTNLQSMTLS